MYFHPAPTLATSTPHRAGQVLRKWRQATETDRPMVRRLFPRRGSRPWLVGGLGGLLVAASLSTMAHAAVKRTGPISSFTGVDEIVEACTTTTSYATIPSMTRTFTLGGTANASVAVLFKGALSLSSGSGFDTSYIRLQIDGVTQSPGEIPVKGEGDPLIATHGFNWQIPRMLAPGTHTARIQWRTDLAQQLCVDARSLIILHK